MTPDPDRWRALNESERECLRAIRAFRETQEASGQGEELALAFQFPEVLMLWLASRLNDRAPKYPKLPEADLEVHRIGRFAAHHRTPAVTIPIRALVEGFERLGFLVVPPDPRETRDSEPPKAQA